MRCFVFFVLMRCFFNPVYASINGPLLCHRKKITKLQYEFDGILREKEALSFELHGAKKEMEVMKKELGDVKDQVVVLKSFDEEGEKRQKVFEKVERVRMIMIFRS